MKCEFCGETKGTMREIGTWDGKYCPFSMCSQCKEQLNEDLGDCDARWKMLPALWVFEI